MDVGLYLDESIFLDTISENYADFLKCSKVVCKFNKMERGEVSRPYEKVEIIQFPFQKIERGTIIIISIDTTKWEFVKKQNINRGVLAFKNIISCLEKIYSYVLKIEFDTNFSGEVENFAKLYLNYKTEIKNEDYSLEENKTVSFEDVKNNTKIFKVLLVGESSFQDEIFIDRGNREIKFKYVPTEHEDKTMFLYNFLKNLKEIIIEIIKKALNEGIFFLTFNSYMDYIHKPSFMFSNFSRFFLKKTIENTQFSKKITISENSFENIIDENNFYGSLFTTEEIYEPNYFEYGAIRLIMNGEDLFGNVYISYYEKDSFIFDNYRILFIKFTDKSELFENKSFENESFFSFKFTYYVNAYDEFKIDYEIINKKSINIIFITSINIKKNYNGKFMVGVINFFENSDLYKNCNSLNNIVFESKKNKLFKLRHESVFNEFFDEYPDYFGLDEEDSNSFSSEE